MGPFTAHAGALVRGVARSFANCLKATSPASPIDVALAAQQHAIYVQLLRRLVPRVVEVPADEAYPDCVFIEDTAVVVPGVGAVIARPGAQERQGEEAAVAQALDRQAVPLLHRIQAPGTLDGGDVLQVGNTMLVGMSKRTNAAGLEQLAAAFQPSGVQVLGVPLDVGLHLKSAVTALDDDTLLASDDEAGRAVVGRLQARAELARRFRVEWVPDALAANVLRTGRHIVVQGSLPASEAVLRRLCDARHLELHTVPQQTETAKADGALTCCSIFF